MHQSLLCMGQCVPRIRPTSRDLPNRCLVIGLIKETAMYDGQLIRVCVKAILNQPDESLRVGPATMLNCSWCPQCWAKWLQNVIRDICYRQVFAAAHDPARSYHVVDCVGRSESCSSLRPPCQATQSEVFPRRQPLPVIIAPNFIPGRKRCSDWEINMVVKYTLGHGHLIILLACAMARRVGFSSVAILIIAIVSRRSAASSWKRSKPRGGRQVHDGNAIQDRGGLKSEI